MSRSYRKYKGLNHTCSDMKFEKSMKVKRRKRLRSKAKVSEDGVELFKKCHRSNCYDGASFTERVYEEDAKRRSKGYSPKRVAHRLIGK